MRPRFAILALIAALLGTIIAVAGRTTTVPCLSGFVRDPNGNPVAGGDLDFFVASTGVKLLTPNDNTDAFGFYLVCVLPNVYHVTYAPPLGTRLMGKRFDNVDLTANQGKEMNVTLDFGTVVSGRVTDLAANPIGNVDVDVDRVSGGRVFTPDDDSSPLDGRYRVVVPNGTYRIRFEPLRGTRWRGLQFDSVTVRGDTAIDVSLVEGVLLQGRVRETSGANIPGIDVELREQATGKKVFLANNTSDASGDYIVAAPTGPYELRFSPPRGSHFIGARLDSFLIAGDTRRDQVLQRGVVLTAAVRDTSGNPVQGADIDLKREATGEKLFTPNDETDASGTAIVSFLPDVYTIEIDPPLGTTYDQLIVTGLSLLTDTTIVFELPEVVRVLATGSVTDSMGNGLADVDIDAHLRPTGRKVYLPNNLTDVSGNFELSIPIGDYDVFFAPPPGSRQVGRVVRNVPVWQDSAWGTIVLRDGYKVTVHVSDEGGNAIAGVDLDFVSERTGEEVFTPHDNTNAQGRAQVTVPPDRYTVELTPLQNSSFEPLRTAGVDVRADTTIALVLKASRKDAPPGGFELRQNYPNPFNGVTTIRYDIMIEGSASIKIYNVRGQLVRVLRNGFHAVDSFETAWDGRDSAGREVAAGVYFVQLNTPRGSQTKKLQLVR